MSEQPLPISLWLRLCRWLWKYPLPFLFSTLIINIAINIGSTWLITPATTKAIPNTSIVGNIIGLVSSHWVLSLFFSMISIALLLVTWLGSRESESTPAMPHQVQMSVRDRERVLRRLHVRYEQLLAQSLQGAVEIELGLTSRPAAIQNAVSLSLRLPEQPEQALPAHASIVDAYNLAQQELLILGEPGAGKSMVLLKLAQHLVDLAEQDMAQPLPVVLPLSSWATKRLPLQDWLIEQFTLLYDVPRQLSHDWMQAGLILPLLDGLDEMEESARPACTVAINTYHREHLQPLIVCSRTTEYDTATLHERLALHTAIVVQPLTLAQVDAHLATIGKPLTALRTALKKNTTLQTLATTPLFLQILMLTYHGIPVRGLSHKEDQLREQIWTDYVQRMVNRKGEVKRYPLNVTSRWLSMLAQQMREHHQTIFFLEQLEVDWLPERRRTIYWWIFGTLGRLFGGLLGGLICGLRLGLLGGLLGALCFGFLFDVSSRQRSRYFSDQEIKSRMVNKIIPKIKDANHAEMIGQILMYPSNKRIRISMKDGLLDGLTVGLLTGLFFLLAGGPLIGLLSGLLTGLFLWVGGGLDRVLYHYFLRFWLWRCHLFPLKAVPFLEDATARVLLRRIGGGYSFTHRLLLDYFADMETAPPAPSSNPHPVPPPSTP